MDFIQQYLAADGGRSVGSISRDSGGSFVHESQVGPAAAAIFSSQARRKTTRIQNYHGTKQIVQSEF